MKNKRVKQLDKKIILLSAIVLVLLAIQLEWLSINKVRQQFRCALRRRGGAGGGGRSGGNPAATTAAVAVSPAVPATTTTAALTSTGTPLPIGVSQVCNKGNSTTIGGPQNQVVLSKSHRQ